MDEHTQQLLATYRSAHQPAPELAAQEFARVQARIAAGDLGPPLPPEAGAGTGLGFAIKAFVVGIAVGGAGIAGYVHLQSEPMSQPVASLVAPQLPQADAEPRVVPEQPAALAIEAGQVPAGAAELAVAVELEDIETVPRAKPRRRAKSRRGATPTAEPASTLGAEMKLLRSAQSALQADNPAGALKLLDQHRRRFPKGLLTPERDIKRAVALCDLGRTKAARRAAKKFLRAHPGSTHTGRARRICTEERP